MFPLDGSSVGYSTVCYARSQSSTNPKFFKSKISGSRCKISNLSVPDNKLAGTNLAAKMAITILDSLPEFPKKLFLIFLTDSQCTGFSKNPLLQIKDRRWWNLIVRWSRMVKGICTKYSFVPILFVWISGKRNVSDLNYKRASHGISHL